MKKIRGWVGIDPGTTGCACLLTADQIHFHSFTSALQAAQAVETWAHLYQVSVILEKVHSTPNDGHVGAFKFGMNYGIWQGILAALHINFTQVSPQKWKRAILGKPVKGEDKKAKSITMCHRIIPELRKVIYLKKHHDKAEAFLLAYYLKNLEGGAS